MEIVRNTAAPQLDALLGEDTNLFMVLWMLLRGSCDTIVTDGDRLIMALSARPAPVWVFMPDDVTDEELERCWQAMRGTFPPALGDSFNLKPAHAAYMKRRAQEEGLTLRTTRRLRAHTCTALRPPHRRPGGCMFAAKPADIDAAAAFVLGMHRDTREGDQTPEGCRAIAQQRIENTRLFLRDNPEITGEIEAILRKELFENPIPVGEEAAAQNEEDEDDLALLEEDEGLDGEE